MIKKIPILKNPIIKMGYIKELGRTTKFSQVF
jgi:hypothetical protein